MFDDVPTKDSNRASRRLHARRMKYRAESYGRDYKDAEHLASCSCHMCGNPRKHWKQTTLKERLTRLDYE